MCLKVSCHESSPKQFSSTGSMISAIFFLSPPLLINVIHWLIRLISGKEKSSSLLLLKVTLTGQYPVITNPANHNRLLFKDFKQIGGYYHLSGSFSGSSPFHVTDTLTVSLKITVLTGRLWSSSQFLIFLLWLQRRSSTTQEHPFGSLENRQACSPRLLCYKALVSLVTSSVSHCKVLDIVLGTLCPDTH